MPALLESEKKKRDQKKVEDLYVKYDRLLYVVAYKMVGHHEDTEDILMMVWETVVKCLDKVGEIEDPRTKGLLITITERKAIDYLRKRYRYRDVEVLTELYESSSFYAVTDERFHSFELHEVIQSLPKKYAEVLFLYYIYGFSGDEMADILGAKTPAVMKRLERARKQLKTVLSEAENFKEAI